MVSLFPWKESPLSEGPLVARVLRDSLHGAPRAGAAGLLVLLSPPGVKWSCYRAVAPSCLWAPERHSYIYVCFFQLSKGMPKKKKSCFQVDSITNLKLLCHCFGIKNKTKCTQWCRQALFVQASGRWSAASLPPHCLLLHLQAWWPPLFWPLYSQCPFKPRTLPMISLLFLSLFA